MMPSNSFVATLVQQSRELVRIQRIIRTLIFETYAIIIIPEFPGVYLFNLTGHPETPVADSSSPLPPGMHQES